MLIGLGLGLLLTTGFAFQLGWLPPVDECAVQQEAFESEDNCRDLGPFGWLLPIAAVLVLGLGGWTAWADHRGRAGPLAAWYPNEDHSHVRTRVEEALALAEDAPGDAWARLEHALLKGDGTEARPASDPAAAVALLSDDE